MAINPINKQDKDYLGAVEDYATIGKISVLTKRLASDDKGIVTAAELELKSIKVRINAALGIVAFTPEQASSVGLAVKGGEMVSGSDILSCLRNGREVSKAFRVAAGLSAE